MNYTDEAARKALARTLAAEGIVLLKNEAGILPLESGSRVALLGRTQSHPVIGGGGSGFSACANPARLDRELADAGLALDEGVLAFYEEASAGELSADAERQKQMAEFFSGGIEGLVASGAIYELFGHYNAPKPEPEVPWEVLSGAAEKTDTAILIIGRESGGEECDRRVEDDYYLTSSEQSLVDAAAQHFAKIIVVFNVNGAVDTAWMDRYPQICAAFFMGTAGEQGAAALAALITGKAVPSGRLSQTLAPSYEAYPTAADFSFSKDEGGRILTYEDYGLRAADFKSAGFDKSPVTVYREDIYLGYRYFSTFEKPTVFSFGHGLSYASFEIRVVSADLYEGSLNVTLSVTNTSDRFAGRETVMLYATTLGTRLVRPAAELRAFAKTERLSPGQTESLVLSVPLQELAAFDEAANAWGLDAGLYLFCAGSTPESAVPAALLSVEEDIVIRQTEASIGMRPETSKKLDLLIAPERPVPDLEDGALKVSALGLSTQTEDGTSSFSGPNRLTPLTVSREMLCLSWPSEPIYDFSVSAEASVLADVAEGRVSMEAFLNQMSAEELAVLCTGWGCGLPFGGMAAKEAPKSLTYPDGNDIGTCSVEGAMQGYVSPALEKYGIPSAVYKDGPASVGMTAWPTGMVLAQTWDPQLLYEFGKACGCEAAMQGVHSWLAPGMNLMRNPIGGRNFEYFSEDPCLTAVCAVEITRGCQENNPVSTCPKHFALNEQETYRRGSSKKNFDAADSIVSARAARELYLKPFEKVLTEAAPATMMTSFNKINGTFAAENEALCTGILRGEWGYDGVVVTDWGDMDCVCDGAKAVAAGNDVVMPGGPPVMRQILDGLAKGSVTLNQMKLGAAHLLNFVMRARF